MKTDLLHTIGRRRAKSICYVLRHNQLATNIYERKVMEKTKENDKEQPTSRTWLENGLIVCKIKQDWRNPLSHTHTCRLTAIDDNNTPDVQGLV